MTTFQDNPEINLIISYNAGDLTARVDSILHHKLFTGMLIYLRVQGYDKKFDAGFSLC